MVNSWTRFSRDFSSCSALVRLPRLSTVRLYSVPKRCSSRCDCCRWWKVHAATAINASTTITAKSMEVCASIVFMVNS